MTTSEHREEHHLIDIGVTIGVAKGCSLSPLMGALVLKLLDRNIPPRWAYARYMDDWVVLTRTGRQKPAVKVRQVVKKMHRIVRGLKLRLALKKTFMGRISKGFDGQHAGHSRRLVATRFAIWALSMLLQIRTIKV